MLVMVTVLLGNLVDLTVVLRSFSIILLPQSKLLIDISDFKLFFTFEFRYMVSLYIRELEQLYFPIVELPRISISSLSMIMVLGSVKKEMGLALSRKNESTKPKTINETLCNIFFRMKLLLQILDRWIYHHKSYSH